MRKTIKVSLIVCLLALVSVMFAAPVKTGESPSMGLGFGTSGLYLKFLSNSRVSYEGRFYFFENGITSMGPRVYINFNPNDPFVVSVGPELDLITFDVSGVSGFGAMFYGFINTDWHLTRNLGLSFDCGPAYVWLMELSGVGYEKADFLYNAGIYLYF